MHGRLADRAAEIRPGNIVVLKADAYVPKMEPAEKLQILAEDPAELVETILRNVLGEEHERLLQRKVYFDNLGSDAARRVRVEVRREGEGFLRRMNRLLARYDRDRNPKAPGGVRLYAGLGLYFFDEELAADRASGARVSERRRLPKERHR